jgi:5-methylcytosine-specific restriction endonuclease McrA
MISNYGLDDASDEGPNNIMDNHLKYIKKQNYGDSIDNSPVLVLNADYTPLSFLPLSIWSWQDAIRTVLQEKAVVVAEYNNLVIRSVRLQIKVPKVIALKTYFRVPDNHIAIMNRRNVYIRDNFKCQYCYNPFSVDQLSLDHVIPRSAGGKLTWQNTVTCCKQCNFRKGSALPDQLPALNMRLRSIPRAPSYNEIQEKSRNLRKHDFYAKHAIWKEYL